MLSAAELLPASISAGETIEYYSRMYPAGDKRGYRVEVVVLVDSSQEEFPVRVDTGELLHLDMLLRKMTPEGRYQKLRAYHLNDEKYIKPSRAHMLNKALEGVVESKFAQWNQSRLTTAADPASQNSNPGVQDSCPQCGVVRSKFNTFKFWYCVTQMTK